MRLNMEISWGINMGQDMNKVGLRWVLITRWGDGLRRGGWEMRNKWMWATQQYTTPQPVAVWNGG